MTAIEIDKAMTDIVLEKQAECKSRLEAIPKENRNERKAVQIELGMYTLCLNAGLLHCRGDRLSIRQNFMRNVLPRFPRVHAVYSALDEAEKTIFFAALQSELFMRDQIYRNYLAELAEAKAAGDTQNVFELQLKAGTVENVFAAWEAWRVANNVYPHMFEEAAE